MSEAVQRNGEGRTGVAFRIVMAAGLLLTLTANLPGQMTFDSVVSLTEARTGVRQTWAPAISSGILRPFDSLVAGTGLYVTASAALLFLSLMSLSRLRPRTAWAAVFVGALVILTPQLLIYQGIVWRDVLFANLSIAGFVMLAHAAQRWAEKPVLPLVGALVCLAAAAIARQNGLILVVMAAIALGWIVRASGWRASLGWGMGGFVAAVALAFAFNQLALPAEIPEALKKDVGFRILEHYDIVGAEAHHPTLKLKEIAKVAPESAAYLEAHSAQIYSASRIDTLDNDPVLGRSLWQTPAAAITAQWRHIVIHAPAAYLLQRADVFRWTFLTPKLELCLPVAVGVSGSETMLKDLGIPGGVDRQAQGLAQYAQHFYRTPVYSHLFWAVAALGVIGLLLRRRDPADWVFIALMTGALGFAASFAVISVACDYRYLYLLDLAAMVGLIYTALDPPRLRKA